MHDKNEDYLGYDESLGLFMVADGVGGGAAGELASRLAVETALDYARKRLGAGYFRAALAWRAFSSTSAMLTAAPP